MLKGFFKKIKEVAGDLSPFAGLAASAFGLGPLYSTLIGAGVPLLAGRGGQQALAGGIGGYFGGKTFGSRFGGQVPYVSPLDILKNKGISGVGGLDAASKVTPARDLVFDRFKDSLVFDKFGKDNPLRYAPSAILGSGVLAGLGAFEDPTLTDMTRDEFQYDAANNPFLIKDRFLKKAQDADIIGNEPGDVYDFLKKFGLIPNRDGNRMTFEDGEGTVMGITPQKLTRMPTTEEIIESSNRIAQMEGQQEYEAYLKRLILESLKKGKPERDTVIPGKGGKGNFTPADIRQMPTISREMASGGGIGDLIEPGMMGGQIGGDRVNPTGGRLVGMGAGREDLLEGEIVDPNTGQTQDILVSNNEHVIPEYTLFALGGGDTEKGQQIMDNLRAKTKPQAEAMGYDFQGAEDGSMNYAPLMAQDGIDSGTIGKSDNKIFDLSKKLKFLQEGIENEQRILEMTRDQKSADKLRQLQAEQRSLLDRLGITKDDLARINMNMKDGTDTKGIDTINKDVGGLMTAAKELSDFLRSGNRELTEEDAMKQSVIAVQRFGADKVREMIQANRMRQMEINKQKGMISRSPGVEVFDLPTMGAQDGIGTNDPTKNLQAMISKMMAQGKSIKEIMAIMSKLKMGMPQRAQMPMMKAMDGMGTEEVNGLKKMGMQDGSMTGDPMLQKGLGNILDSMAKAEQMNMMST